MWFRFQPVSFQRINSIAILVAARIPVQMEFSVGTGREVAIRAEIRRVVFDERLLVVTRAQHLDPPRTKSPGQLEVEAAPEIHYSRFERASARRSAMARWVP